MVWNQSMNNWKTIFNLSVTNLDEWLNGEKSISCVTYFYLKTIKSINEILGTCDR